MPGNRADTPRRSTTLLAAAAVVALLATTACSPEAGSQASPRVTQEAEVVTPKTVPPQPAGPAAKPKPKPVRWPLTGTPAARKTLPERPALAIKVENSRESRPHTGLHNADIVWEQVVEGGITRFVAVYHSQRPRTVGPIRSVRPMDAAIVAPMRGMLVFSGGQRAFIDRVREGNVQSVIMDRGAPGFWRSSDRYAPHNVYGSPATFWRQAWNSRAEHPPRQFVHAAKRGQGSAARIGQRARVADVRLSTYQRTVWKWSHKQRVYLRSDGGTPSISSGKQIGARNVLLMSVRMEATRFRDPSGARVPETRMVGNGTGVLLSGGRSLRVHWKKRGLADPVVLERPNGRPVELDPGNLWVELVPRGSGSWNIR